MRERTFASARFEQRQSATPPANERAATTFFWSFYAAVYDLIWDSPITLALANVAETHLPGAGTVVDLGCGTGLLTRDRSQYSIGVDANRAMLTRAIRRRRIDLAVHGWADVTGLPTSTANAVIVSNVLHLHPKPRAVITEALRICAPSGRVFLCWPLDDPDTDSVFLLDSRLGRSIASAMLAHGLRRLIGIVAVLTRTSRNSSASIEHALHDAAGYDVVLDTVLHDCQRIVILVPSAVDRLSADSSTTERDIRKRVMSTQ
jgi:SAM-dependent methyltransferase